MNNGLGSGLVTRINLQFFLQFFGEFDQIARDGFGRTRIHPRDEVPVCVFALFGESCGKLSLSTATHANQNCALLRRIGDQLV